MHSDSISMGDALKAIGITRHTYLNWEALLKLQPPRDAKGRVFPQQLVSNLKALKQLLEDSDIDLAFWLRWEQSLLLLWGKDAWGAPNIAGDTYYATYTKRMTQDMAEATVGPEELMRWRGELDVCYPTDARGNITLTPDWVKYLRAVQEAYAAGRNTYWCIYNIRTPNQVRPQLAMAGPGPEY